MAEDNRPSPRSTAKVAWLAVRSSAVAGSARSAAAWDSHHARRRSSVQPPLSTQETSRLRTHARANSPTLRGRMLLAMKWIETAVNRDRRLVSGFTAASRTFHRRARIRNPNVARKTEAKRSQGSPCRTLARISEISTPASAHHRSATGERPSRSARASAAPASGRSATATRSKCSSARDPAPASR